MARALAATTLGVSPGERARVLSCIASIAAFQHDPMPRRHRPALDGSVTTVDIHELQEIRGYVARGAALEISSRRCDAGRRLALAFIPMDRSTKWPDFLVREHLSAA